MRSSSARISVPLPTPDGPVMTKTLAKPAALLAPQHADELVALALGEAADRLARRDLAGAQDLVDLHAPVLRDREEHVDDLGGLDVFGRLEEQRVDRMSAGLEIALELSALRADLVRALERVHPLYERPFGGRRLLCGRVGGGRRHGRRVYTGGRGVQALLREK